MKLLPSICQHGGGGGLRAILQPATRGRFGSLRRRPKVQIQPVCGSRCCSAWHRDPHGPRGGTRGSTQRQGGRMELLLHAAARAQWMPPVDTLLLPSSVSPGQSLLCRHCWRFGPELRYSHTSLVVRSSMSPRLSGRCRPTVTTSRPKCSELDSRKTPSDGCQQRSSGGRPPRPSEQVRSHLRM